MVSRYLPTLFSRFSDAYKNCVVVSGTLKHGRILMYTYLLVPILNSNQHNKKIKIRIKTKIRRTCTLRGFAHQ